MKKPPAFFFLLCWLPAVLGATPPDTTAPADPAVLAASRAHLQKLSMMLVGKMRYQKSLEGQKCKVEIRQGRDGRITDLSYLDCDSPQFREVVRGIIESSSPFPLPKDMRAFGELFRVTFEAPRPL